MNLRNVWRLGTNWGGTPILDLFFDYEVAFFGTDSERLGNYKAAKPGDLLAVTDFSSYRIVVIAEVLTPFSPLNRIGIPFSQSFLDNYGDSSTFGCRAKFYLLPEKDRHNCTDYKRFYSMGQDTRINDLYMQLYNKEEQGHFDINPRTETLFKRSEERIGLFSSNIRYRIPIYQRPYSWGQTEITKLLEELFLGSSTNENKFIGTMQLSEPIPLDADGQRVAYDVIDGQQRITTLLLIFRILQLGWGVFQEIDFSGFVRTVVNRGEAQRSLDAVWNLSLEDLKTSDMSNIYCQNMGIIFSELKGRLTREGNVPSDGEKVISPEVLEQYLKESVLLVVIQTNAGLSKTLEIFNIINTTGLDLNGADIFKIRFYEFLTNVRDENQEVFDKVSELYEEIDRRNRTSRVKSSMAEILEILQPIIVGKYGIRLEFMDYAADRFFSELFDSLLGIKYWEHFKKEKVSTIVQDKEGPLSILGIKKLIEFRYEYGAITEMPHEQFDDSKLPIFESAFLYEMMFWSRYSRYWFYPIIFRYRFGEYSSYREELFKVAIVYSIINAKAIYSVRNSIQDSCRKMFETNTTYNSVLESLKAKRLEAKDAFRNAIFEYEIAWNSKWKNIVCRLSEFLTYSSEEKGEPNFDAYYSLFLETMDIEHIQSYHDEDDNLRDAIWSDWKGILNGIGNLMMLESNINRSIRNKKFEEKVNLERNLSYHNSKYRNVQEIAKLSTWTKEQCEARRVAEADKLMGFLFDDDPSGVAPQMEKS